MRSNRMLYPPNGEPFDPALAPGASFIPFSKVPLTVHYGLVAVCHLSLDARLKETGHKGRRIFRALEGGWFRIMGISLPAGRFAYVQEFEHHPGDVHLHLETWRDVHIHRVDYFVARDLLGLTDSQVTLCDGPFLWR